MGCADFRGSTFKTRSRRVNSALENDTLTPVTLSITHPPASVMALKAAEIASV